MVALMPSFYVPNEARIELNAPVLLFSFGGCHADRGSLRAGASDQVLPRRLNRRAEG